MDTTIDPIETLTANFTEAQLRAALERVKTEAEEKKRQRFAAVAATVTCECGNRAQYTAHPESVKYTFDRVEWNDETCVATRHHASRLTDDFNGEQPGDDDYENPSTDEYIAFAWCGGDCEWFAIGTESNAARLFAELAYFR